MKRWTINSEEQFYNSILKYGIDEVNLALELKEKYYDNQIKIPKKNGVRTIYVIDKNHALFRIQRAFFQNFLTNISISDVARGFVKNSCYYDFLEPHIDFYKKNAYLRLDIKDFFGSISEQLIRESMIYYCKIENPDEKQRVLDTIISIVTNENHVIQGLTTSPSISNIVFREFDIRIQKYCHGFDANYTRYADDLLFSSNNHNILQKSFTKGIAKIISDKGFNLNYSKAIRGIGYISLNGYVISNSIKLSRSKLNDINRIIFFMKNKTNIRDVKNGNLSDLNEYIKAHTKDTRDRFINKPQLINYLNGYRAFLISLLKKTDNIDIIKNYGYLIGSIEHLVCMII